MSKGVNGMTRYFWMHFVTQARQILESVNLVNTEEFSIGATIIDRIEALHIHHIERGERDKKYEQFLATTYIADLFYDKKEKDFNIVEAVRLLPTHIYRLPGSRAMTKKQIADVVVQNREHSGCDWIRR
ncbi:unnamed protein product [Calypogeia fissa]